MNLPVSTHSAAKHPSSDEAGNPDAKGGQAALEAYFDQWQEIFHRHSLTDSERLYQIGEYHIRLRFAGDSLVPLLTAALAHLPPGQPAQGSSLEVLCWDAAATAARPPESPWRWPHQWRQGSAFCPFGNSLFQVAILSNAGDFMVFRADTGQALLWVRDAQALAVQHHGAPLLVVFAAWANSHGLRLVHAGCVGTDRGAVLLVGKGGAGKSTTCLLCAEAGLDYLSDDYCLVGLKPVPTAFSLYCSGKLHRHILPSFPRLAALAVDPGANDPSTKPVIYLRQDHGYAVTSQRPLRAIVVPTVTGRPETTFERTSAAQALLALAPSTLFQLPNSGNGAFQSLTQLVRTLPCFRLNLGTRFETIPPAIRALLAGLP